MISTVITELTAVFQVLLNNIIVSCHFVCNHVSMTTQSVIYISLWNMIRHNSHTVYKVKQAEVMLLIDSTLKHAPSLWNLIIHLCHVASVSWALKKLIYSVNLWYSKIPSNMLKNYERHQKHNILGGGNNNNKLLVL